MRKMQLLSQAEIKKIIDFHDKLQVIVNNNSLIGDAKKYLYLAFGVELKKSNGRGNLEIIFSPVNFHFNKKNSQAIYLNEVNDEIKNRIKLINNVYKYKKIKLHFKKFSSYNKINNSTIKKYVDQLHPEALVLSPICIGRGIDVGCGFRKTHPNAIGVDWIGKGELGKAGNVKGKESEADVKAKGDNLSMFKNNSLDYVVSRHNLEHYHNPRKTLLEWLRVLKKGGYLGIVVPNSDNPHTAEKTHYFNFTLNNFRQMLKGTNQLKVVKVGECIPGWSFFGICQKIS